MPCATSTDTRSTTDSITAYAMSSRGVPLPMRLMTSDSANTVHMDEMDVGAPIRARRASSSWLTPRRFAMTSRNFPVPAEHLSFIANLTTLPPRSTMTFVSWPPTSTTVPPPPNRKAAPLPWQVISVTTRSA